MARAKNRGYQQSFSPSYTIRRWRLGIYIRLSKEDLKKGNAKNIFKISKIEGILTAYKLFYVGCSRARKNLVIVVDETKINKFENEFKAKLISIGFEIQGFPMQETATV